MEVNIVNFIYKWQSLAGAFIGAFIPITFSLFLYFLTNRRDFKRNLGQIEKFVVSSINNLYGLREDLELFIIRLNSLIDGVEKSSQGEYFMGTTNFPFQELEYDINIFDKKTKSLYLLNKIMKCHSLIKSISLDVTNLREEFKQIIDRNLMIILSYKDPSQKIGISSENQKKIYLDQLKAMRKVIKEVILEKNIPTTIKSFFGARIFLNKYFRYGIFAKIYYEGLRGRVFKKENAQEIIEKKFSEELEKEIVKVEKIFNTKIK